MRHFWCCLCCLLWAGLAQTAQALEIQDDLGRTVSLPKPAERIVSILPSLSEFVCALDQCQRLVGVDQHSTWPARLNTLPRVGGGLNPNLEAIVALRPDLVLAATSAHRATERLATLGIPVLSLNPQSYADAKRVLNKIGLALAVDTTSLWRSMNTDIAASAQALPAHTQNIRVYFEVDSALYAAGEASFIGTILSRLGVDNIVPAALGAFPKLNPEYIVRANPDLIMLSERSLSVLLQRPGWQSIKAVQENRICTFSPSEGDILMRPGPRMLQAARWIARCLLQKMPMPSLMYAQGFE